MNHERLEKIYKLFGDRHPANCVPSRYLYVEKNPTAEGILYLPDDESAMTPKARAAKAYHAELVASSDEELDRRLAEAAQLAREAKIAAHPFNVPHAMANDDVYDYWSKAAYWRLEEAVALSMGRDPSKVITLTKRRTDAYPKFHPDTCGPDFEARYELAKRAVAYKQLFDQTMPGLFLAWANRNRISVPEELLKIVQEHGIQVADWKTLYDGEARSNEALKARIQELESAGSERSPMPSPSGTTRERNTLLKIVLGLAMDCYGYQPTAPRTSTAREIADALELKGISVSEDTIRKYLSEAAEFAPPKHA